MDKGVMTRQRSSQRGSRRSRKSANPLPTLRVLDCGPDTDRPPEDPEENPDDPPSPMDGQAYSPERPAQSSLTAQGSLEGYPGNTIPSVGSKTDAPRACVQQAGEKDHEGLGKFPKVSLDDSSMLLRPFGDIGELPENIFQSDDEKREKPETPQSDDATDAESAAAAAAAESDTASSPGASADASAGTVPENEDPSLPRDGSKSPSKALPVSSSSAPKSDASSKRPRDASESSRRVSSMARDGARGMAAKPQGSSATPNDIFLKLDDLKPGENDDLLMTADDFLDTYCQFSLPAGRASRSSPRAAPTPEEDSLPWRESGPRYQQKRRDVVGSPTSPRAAYQFRGGMRGTVTSASPALSMNPATSSVCMGSQSSAKYLMTSPGRESQGYQVQKATVQKHLGASASGAPQEGPSSFQADKKVQAGSLVEHSGSRKGVKHGLSLEAGRSKYDSAQTAEKVAKLRGGVIFKMSGQDDLNRNNSASRPLYPKPSVLVKKDASCSPGLALQIVPHAERKGSRQLEAGSSLLLSPPLLKGHGVATQPGSVGTPTGQGPHHLTFLSDLLARCPKLHDVITAHVTWCSCCQKTPAALPSGRVAPQSVMTRPSQTAPPSQPSSLQKILGQGPGPSQASPSAESQTPGSAAKPFSRSSPDGSSPRILSLPRGASTESVVRHGEASSPTATNSSSSSSGTAANSPTSVFLGPEGSCGRQGGKASGHGPTPGGGRPSVMDVVERLEKKMQATSAASTFVVSTATATTSADACVSSSQRARLPKPEDPHGMDKGSASSPTRPGDRQRGVGQAASDNLGRAKEVSLSLPKSSVALGREGWTPVQASFQMASRPIGQRVLAGSRDVQLPYPKYIRVPIVNPQLVSTAPPGSKAVAVGGFSDQLGSDQQRRFGPSAQVTAQSFRSEAERNQTVYFLRDASTRIKKEDEDEDAEEPGTTYLCQDCGKTFPDSVTLRLHCQSHVEAKIRCETCGRIFKMEADLRIHMQVHTNKRPFSCDVCGRLFNEMKNLSRHYKIHSDERPYPCHLCDKRFRQSGTLKMHIALHSGEKPYICDVCGKEFALKTGLKRHKRVHTGERPYVCRVCGKTFGDHSSLRTHCFSHTGVKPFVCDTCHKGFSQRSDLKRHMQTHTAGKEYSCDVCGKKFGYLRSLNSHRELHTLQKSFACDLCDKMFTRSRYLRRHRALHLQAVRQTHAQAGLRGAPPHLQALPPHTQGMSMQVQGLPPHTQGMAMQVQSLPPHTQGMAMQVQSLPPHTQGMPIQVQGIPTQMHGYPPRLLRLPHQLLRMPGAMQLSQIHRLPVSGQQDAPPPFPQGQVQRLLTSPQDLPAQGPGQPGLAEFTRLQVTASPPVKMADQTSGKPSGAEEEEEGLEPTSANLQEASAQAQEVSVPERAESPETEEELPVEEEASSSDQAADVRE